MTLPAIGGRGKRRRWLCLSLTPALVVAVLYPAAGGPAGPVSSACGAGSQKC